MHGLPVVMLLCRPPFLTSLAMTNVSELLNLTLMTLYMLGRPIPPNVTVLWCNCLCVATRLCVDVAEWLLVSELCNTPTVHLLLLLLRMC